MKIFLHPGLYNSGPQHWQTHWENKYGYTRIVQDEWEKPVCDQWLTRIEEYMAGEKVEEVIIVAHSLACSTTVRWAQRYGHLIKGALLVGPSDVDAPNYPSGTTGFMPMPTNRLPFRSIVVASSNDEYVSSERAHEFATAWGSDLINIGALGHINSASNLGDWPEGHAILERLIGHAF